MQIQSSGKFGKIKPSRQLRIAVLLRGGKFILMQPQNFYLPPKMCIKLTQIELRQHTLRKNVKIFHLPKKSEIEYSCQKLEIFIDNNWNGF